MSKVVQTVELGKHFLEVLEVSSPFETQGLSTRFSGDSTAAVAMSGSLLGRCHWSVRDDVGSRLVLRRRPDYARTVPDPAHVRGREGNRVHIFLSAHLRFQHSLFRPWYDFASLQLQPLWTLYALPALLRLPLPPLRGHDVPHERANVPDHIFPRPVRPAVLV